MDVQKSKKTIRWEKIFPLANSDTNLFKISILLGVFLIPDLIKYASEFVAVSLTGTAYYIYVNIQKKSYRVAHIFD